MLGGGWNSSSPSQGHGTELLLGASAPVPAEPSPAWWPRVCGRWLGLTRSRNPGALQSHTGDLVQRASGSLAEREAGEGRE